jgi:hypothetical protein
VVEHPTADRNVPGSNPGAPYIVGKGSVIILVCYDLLKRKYIKKKKFNCSRFLFKLYDVSCKWQTLFILPTHNMFLFLHGWIQSCKSIIDYCVT